MKLKQVQLTYRRDLVGCWSYQVEATGMNCEGVCSERKGDIRRNE